MRHRGDGEAVGNGGAVVEGVGLEDGVHGDSLWQRFGLFVKDIWIIGRFGCFFKANTMAATMEKQPAL